MAQRRLEGPTTIEAAEGILTILLRAGLSDDAAVKAFVSLVNFTLGMSFYRLSRSRAAGDPQRPRFAGVTNDVAPTMFRLRSKMARAGLGDEYFVDGLTRLLDSYAAEAAPPARRRRTRKKA